MKKVDKLLEKVMTVCKIILIIIGISMSVLTFGNAVARKLGTSLLIWADEINRFSFIYMTYFGMIVGAYYGRHAMVDIVIEKLSKVPRGIVTVFGNLLILGFLSVLVYGGVLMMETAGLTKSSVLHIPLSYIYIGLPIGAGITILVYLIHTVSIIRELFQKSEEEVK